MKPDLILKVLCYGKAMLKIRMRQRAADGARARKQLAEIDASISALNNEDLLDLADIFSAEPHTPLGDVAFAEMKRRNLSL
ncbi:MULTISPECIES: hypothetical protein [Sphingomonas]|uniref:hypothetical protein n=1 Tax=Sphingomonas TaxID=13687 RepID=UPI002FE126F7